MTEHRDLVVIGAGPAGIAAATTAAGLGLDVLVLDEQPAPGGQAWRAVESPGAPAAVLGDDYAAGGEPVRALRACGAELRASTTVFDVSRARVVHACGPRGAFAVAARRLLLATGAIERPFPVPGWTLPGVMLAGGAQTLLKSAGLVPPDGTVLAGCGPLLWLFAAQCLRAGVRLGAVLETVSWRGRRRALAHLPAALAAQDQIAKGRRWIRAVRAAGVPVVSNVGALRALGGDALQEVEYTCGRQARRRQAPALLLHQGVVPQVNTSMAIGCRHYWDDGQLCFRPVLGEWGDSDIEGIAIAGDGGGIAGAAAAVASGTLAALQTAHALGSLDRAGRDRAAAAPRSALARAMALRPFLEVLYRPLDANRVPPEDATIVCRCEEVTAGRIRDAAATGLRDANALKSRLRCGMGPCQGRYCGLTVTEVLAGAHGIKPRDVGYFRLRPPLKPVDLAALAPFDEGVPAEASLTTSYRGRDGP